MLLQRSVLVQSLLVEKHGFIVEAKFAKVDFVELDVVVTKLLD